MIISIDIVMFKNQIKVAQDLILSRFCWPIAFLCEHKLPRKVDLDLDFVQDQFIQAPVEGGDPRGVKVRQRVLHQAWRSTESYRWLKIYEDGGDLAGGDGDDGGDLADGKKMVVVYNCII